MTISLIPYRRHFDWDVIQVHLWQATGVLKNKLIINYSKTPLILLILLILLKWPEKDNRDQYIEVKILVHKGCVWAFQHTLTYPLYMYLKFHCSRYSSTEYPLQVLMSI